jgi:hypothetical protein
LDDQDQIDCMLEQTGGMTGNNKSNYHYKWEW